MSNPYEPAQPEYSGVPNPMAQPYLDGVSWGRAIQAPFKSPNWIMNVVWTFLCFLLSSVVIGGIILMGYQIDVIEKRSRGRSEYWPDFDINRFSDYLLRGLWPWLISVIGGTVVMVPIYLVGIIGIVIFSAIFGQESPLAAVAVLVIAFLMMFAILFAFAFLIGPCMLRAGLANDLAEGFKIGWAIEFGKKVWLQGLLAMILAVITVLVAEVVGILLCFVGIMVTLPLAQLMVTDFGVQIYDIFLNRGGEPVVAKPTNL